ncbi:electron transfer flavoprotein subunit alpha [Saccharolobus solfataricus]|uniref:Electron transfer flavoprotein alpha and beta-subunit (EtfAB/fixAB) n=3 Tax=Saccharolobus solfataricus TaxID=2287 RepID=Q97V19_SACS2|nr:FAD-binding protein [Saccharolobus solfataricus]AAK42928.1 Electron transfer flavoprotein alpha and beta-subunit (etfAB/fixAB) [Saccharolobus solfataricus P2]AKA73019.1 electron transfer flavoprotein subunit alpha [Saccharolobus solfataricus]AKA75717.1 electron transfer flavoprotein subunit alpha [Saccharolobus solfataricus]AKA78409.1 electron transfer flavoprotein subunit alpha [Saccharolobus solfataricus]AZF67528.1 electron transfer flavoprotein subunit alpha [Saccharolobus solfataricus]
MPELKVVVSIKQVPDVDELRIDPVTNNLVREGVPAVINPPDLHAIEEAVRLKERYGAKTIVITMGPPQADSALREALAMGIDEAYLISDRAMAGADTWATSYTISKAVQKLGGADLILFGRRAVDGETEQVGPQTGKWLGLPVIGYVSEIKSLEKDKIVVTRTTEFDEEVIEAPVPVVLTILEVANKPRQPDILSLIKAKTAKVTVWNKDDIKAEPNKIGLAGSPTKVIKVQPPPKTRKAEIIDGKKDVEKAAKWFLDKIFESLKEDESTLKEYVKPKPKVKVNGEIWVYIDHIGEKPNRASFEIMGEARRIADLMDTSLSAVMVGGEATKSLIEETFEYGADKVYFVETKGFDRYDNEVYTRALAKVIKKYKPEAVFFPGTKNARELASTTAIEVDTGLIADCTNFDVDDKGVLLSTRPDFGGKEMSTIICPRHRPVMVTVRAGVFMPLPRVPGRKGELAREEIDDLFTRLKVLDYRVIEKRNILAEADIVIGVGRGIRSPENIKMAEELASLLGGVVGVSKPLADMGWYPKDRQVGQTGTTIRPKVYIALGISGAVQHLVGILSSRKIGAINLDPSAPIFENCDFGVVGDIFEILPKMMELLKKKEVS